MEEQTPDTPDPVKRMEDIGSDAPQQLPQDSSTQVIPENIDEIGTRNPSVEKTLESETTSKVTSESSAGKYGDSNDEVDTDISTEVSKVSTHKRLVEEQMCGPTPKVQKLTTYEQTEKSEICSVKSPVEQKQEDVHLSYSVTPGDTVMEQNTINKSENCESVRVNVQKQSTLFLPRSLGSKRPNITKKPDKKLKSKITLEPEVLHSSEVIRNVSVNTELTTNIVHNTEKSEYVSQSTNITETSENVLHSTELPENVLLGTEIEGNVSEKTGEMVCKLAQTERNEKRDDASVGETDKANVDLSLPQISESMSPKVDKVTSDFNEQLETVAQKNVEVELWDRYVEIYVKECMGVLKY